MLQNTLNNDLDRGLLDGSGVALVPVGVVGHTTGTTDIGRTHDAETARTSSLQGIKQGLPLVLVVFRGSDLSG